MQSRIVKTCNVLGSAVALGLLCLVGAGQSAPAGAEQSAYAASAGSHGVPAGFHPVAATFFSPARGVALGSAGSSYHAALAVTADGGAHWSAMRAPDVWLRGGGSSRRLVTQVTFASRADGWLYGRYDSGHVWATHNGGASWREMTLRGNVSAVTAAAHAVYAVAGGHLYRSPLGRDAWRQVSAAPRHGAITGTTLAVSGDAAWLGSSTVLWSTKDGVHWASRVLHSPGAYFGIPYQLAGIAAASPRSVAFLWAAPTGMFRTGMKVLVSSDGGRSQRQTRVSPPPAGEVAAFAVSPGRLSVISVGVVTPGLDNVYRLADPGRTWITFRVPGTSGGAMLNSLQFMSPTAGCLVTGSPGPGGKGQLLRTKDAGRTWHTVRF